MNIFIRLAVCTFCINMLVSCGDSESFSPVLNDTYLESMVSQSSYSANSELYEEVSYETLKEISEADKLKPFDLKGNEDTVSFTCKMNHNIRIVNAEIQKERIDFKKLFAKLQSGKLSQADSISLTYLLIKYRLFNNDSYYYKPYDYTFSQSVAKFKAAAKKYVLANGAPDSCDFKRDQYEARVSYPLDSSECYNEFLSRAQVLAPGMVLAQVSIESSWGKSRFAREGKNLYGIQAMFSKASVAASKPHCIIAADNNRKCLYKMANTIDGLREYYRFLNSGTSQTYFRYNRSPNTITFEDCYDDKNMPDGLINYAGKSSYTDQISNQVKYVCNRVARCSE